MTTSDATDVNIGTTLKDSLKCVDNWVQYGIKFQEDIEGFYRERAELEKDYSNRLISLTKKYFDKKQKRQVLYGVGDEPKFAPGSLEKYKRSHKNLSDNVYSASLTTWSKILDQAERWAREREKYSQHLVDDIAEEFKTSNFVVDDLRKKHVIFHEHILEEKEKEIAEMKRCKTKYDSACEKVENARKKMDSSGSDLRSKRQYNHNLLEMQNRKNTYILEIRTANELIKQQFHADIPLIINSLQSLNERRVANVNRLWKLANKFDIACLQDTVADLKHVVEQIDMNKPSLDSAFFLAHNKSDFTDPKDFLFEPSPVWLDTDEMATNDSALVFLRNMLAKSNANKLNIEDQQKEIAQDIKAFSEDLDAMGKDVCNKNTMGLLVQILNSEEKKCKLKNEKLKFDIARNIIVSVAGESEGESPHTFKTTSFAIPTSCDYCGRKIWGLTRQGMSCKSCGYNCHAKCEMKVPANCTREKGNVTRSADQDDLDEDDGSFSGPSIDARSVQSQDDSTSLAGSMRQASLRNSAFNDGSGRAGPAPSKITSLRSERSGLWAKALYAYDATNSDETSIKPGDLVQVLSKDDGNGWATVNIDGKKGFVPFSYLQLERSDSLPPALQPRRQGPAVTPKPGAKPLKYVRALYDFAARSERELSIKAGDKILLLNDPVESEWLEGELNRHTGFFPTNYVERL